MTALLIDLTGRVEGVVVGVEKTAGLWGVRSLSLSDN